MQLQAHTVSFSFVISYIFIVIPNLHRSHSLPIETYGFIGPTLCLSKRFNPKRQEYCKRSKKK